jgi:hypothetical protein
MHASVVPSSATWLKHCCLPAWSTHCSSNSQDWCVYLQLLFKVKQVLLPGHTSTLQQQQ